MTAKLKKILLSAGEASGDMHAANLVRNITKTTPNLVFYGMGSKLMQQAGVNIITDANELSVFGALEIITKFIKIWRAFSRMKKALYNDKPDLLILIDYPGFNLRLAKIAKKAGVKVLYFISPKVWAWHQSRVKIIKKYVDMMAVIFPFEVEFYKKFQIPVSFVGNPLLELVPDRSSTLNNAQVLNLDPKQLTVGLFPGSRLSEIKRLLPVMLESIKVLKEHDPNIQFILSQASSIDIKDLEPHLQQNKVNIQIVAGHNYSIMRSCDAIISASGTATLEIALIPTPLVIIYKMPWLEYQIAKRLIKIPYIGLCNILAQKKIVPELIQNDASPQNIASEIEKILNDQVYRDKMNVDLKNIRKILGQEKQTAIVDLIKEML